MQITRHIQHMVHIIFSRPICHGLGEKQAVGKEDAHAALRTQDTSHFSTDGDGAGEVVDGQGWGEEGEKGRERGGSDV